MQCLSAIVIAIISTATVTALYPYLVHCVYGYDVVHLLAVYIR